MSIGGNKWALLQVKDKGAKNGIGAYEAKWTDCTSILGWLDLNTGDSKHTTFNTKVQESTHYFLCDFTNLKALSAKWVWNPFNFLTGVIDKDEQEEIVDITSDNARMVIDGMVYEILLIDNPMNLNEHLEIYLRFIGGQ
jgi:hypothetical protein|nr:MAG TPA: head tail adaptor [Caudoviricetes sp.]